MSAKTLAIFFAERSAGKGKQYLLTHHVLQQQTVLVIIPYFSLVLGNRSLACIRIRVLRTKQQVKLPLQRHRNRLHAACAQDLEIPLVLGSHTDILNLFRGSTMLDNQVRLALYRQRSHLPRVRRVFNRPSGNLFPKYKRLVL